MKIRVKRKWLGPARRAVPEIRDVMTARELPAWLLAFFLRRERPEPGTAERALLDQLEATKPDSLPPDSVARDLWLRHRDALMARWRDESGSDRLPWGARYDRAPDEDPRPMLYGLPAGRL